MSECPDEALLVLVVLYKTPMQESRTLQSLIGQARIPASVRLIIWDNSPQSMRDADTLDALAGRFGAVQYIHDENNKALSSLYNDVVKANPADLYLILDQDSGLPPEYVENALARAAEHPRVALFAPQIVVGGQLVSPGGFGKVRGRQIATVHPGIAPSTGMAVITSGLMFRASLFVEHGLWFNENLWLYAVDTDFFLRFRESFSEFYILDQKIQHDSALRGEMGIEQRLFRFRNLRWSYLRMMKDQGRSMVLPRLYMLTASCNRTLQYRTPRFLLGWNRDR